MAPFLLSPALQAPSLLSYFFPLSQSLIEPLLRPGIVANTENNSCDRRDAMPAAYIEEKAKKEYHRIKGRIKYKVPMRKK